MGSFLYRKETRIYLTNSNIDRIGSRNPFHKMLEERSEASVQETAATKSSQTANSQ